MKININECVEIESLCNKLSNRVIKARTAYKLAKLLKAVSAELAFYRSQFTLYLNEYGEKDEHGDLIVLPDNSIKIISDKLEICKAKLKELDNLEIEILDIEFTIDELEELQVTMKDMSVLATFIKD